MSSELARRCARWLFVTLSGLYVLMGVPHLSVVDSVYMVSVGRALLHDRAVSVPPLLDVSAVDGLRVAPPAADGSPRVYSKYGLGMSLAVLPSLVVADLLTPLATPAEAHVFETPSYREGQYVWRTDTPTCWGDPRSFRRPWEAMDFPLAFSSFLAKTTAAFAIAATAALVLLLATEISGELGIGLTVALTLGLASPLAHYALHLWSESVVAFLLTLAALRVRRWGQVGRRRELVWIGALIGAIALTKVALVVLALPLGLGLLLARPGWDARRLFGAGGLLLLGASPAVGLAMLYNLARFGSALETGYGAEADAWTTPWWEGISGLLLSPGRGMLVYWPLAGLALAALPRLARRDRAMGALSALPLLTLLALYARWYGWDGGWCWGPRFLIPALPLLALPLATLGSAAAPWRHAARALLVLSAAASYNGVMVDFHDYYEWMKRYLSDHPEVLTGAALKDYHVLFRWDWSFSPIVSWWTFPVRDTMLLPWALTRPGVVLGVFGAAAVALGVGLIGLMRAMRGEDVRRDAQSASQT